MKFALTWFIGLCKAFWNFPSFVAAWLKATPASIETSKARLSLCHTCEYLNGITRQCNVCSCFIWLKIQWQEEKCPKGKW